MAETKTVLKGEYDKFPTLTEPLPPLVRKQRRLEAQIAAVAKAVDEEKGVRKEIDALLVAAGMKRSEGVTCLGYDVIHRERNAPQALNEDKLVEQLVLKFGCDRAKVLALIVECTEATGEGSKFAEVKPSKGAKVRRAAA
jgi:hypothetical protein